MLVGVPVSARLNIVIVFEWLRHSLVTLSTRTFTTNVRTYERTNARRTLLNFISDRFLTLCYYKIKLLNNIERRGTSTPRPGLLRSVIEPQSLQVCSVMRSNSYIDM